jgi:hypothetical protein
MDGWRKGHIFILKFPPKKFLLQPFLLKSVVGSCRSLDSLLFLGRFSYSWSELFVTGDVGWGAMERSGIPSCRRLTERLQLFIDAGGLSLVQFSPRQQFWR